MGLVVTSAAVQDRDGGRLLLETVASSLERVKLIWADSAYAGQLVEWALSFGGWVMEIVRRNAEAKGFQVQKRRWVVERTFGWLNRWRRLSKDYEECPESSEAFIYIAMIRNMLRRLAPK